MRNSIATFVGLGMIMLLTASSGSARADEQEKTDGKKEVQIFTPEYQKQRDLAAETATADVPTSDNQRQLRRMEELTSRVDRIH